MNYPDNLNKLKNLRDQIFVNGSFPINEDAIHTKIGGLNLKALDDVIDDLRTEVYKTEVRFFSNGPVYSGIEVHTHEQWERDLGVPLEVTFITGNTLYSTALKPGETQEEALARLRQEAAQ